MKLHFKENFNSTIFSVDTNQYLAYGEDRSLDFLISVINFSNQSDLMDLKLFEEHHRAECTDFKCIFNQSSDSETSTLENMQTKIKTFVEKEATKILQSQDQIRRFLVAFLAPTCKIYGLINEDNYF